LKPLHSRPVRRWFAVAIVVLLAAPDSQPAPATETPTSGAAVATPLRTPGEHNGHAKIRMRRLSRAWWHDARLVEGLKLTGKQQDDMDEFLAGRIAVRQQVLADNRRADAAFKKALGEGNWEAARRQIVTMRGLAGTEAESRLTFRLDVFHILTPDQRRTLAEKYPEVLTQPWLPGFGRRKPISEQGQSSSAAKP